MSLSKILGTVVGALVGVTISSLLVGASLQKSAAPALDVIAVILIGAFLGAVFGAFIGTDDRRFPRGGSDRFKHGLNQEETAALRRWMREENASHHAEPPS